MGLMNSMMSGGPAPADDMEEEQMEGGAPEAEEEEGGEATIPPELAAEIVKALSNPSVKKAIIEAGQSGNPTDALTGIAYGMIEGLDEKAKGQIPPEMMPNIAMEIVDMLGDLAGGGDDLKAQILKLLVEQTTKQSQQFLSRQQQAPQGGVPPQGGPQSQPMPQGVA